MFRLVAHVFLYSICKALKLFLPIAYTAILIVRSLELLVSSSSSSPATPPAHVSHRQKGAPSSLTLIGYREPFAFVGAIGLDPESAAVALDPKKQSKTLLRVQATLAFASDESSSSTASSANRTSAPPQSTAKKSNGNAIGAPLHMCTWHVGEVGLLQELESASSTIDKSETVETSTSGTDDGAAKTIKSVSSARFASSAKEKGAQVKAGASKGKAVAQKRPLDSQGDVETGVKARSKRKL